MKKLVLFLFAMLISTATWAVKAWPYPFEVTQRDGTKVTLVGHGDEDLNWLTTTDGVLVVREESGFYVASVDADGELKATDQLVHNLGQRDSAELQTIAAQDIAGFKSKASSLRHKAMMKREPVNASGKDVRLFPHEGSPKVLVILAQFSDTTKVPIYEDNKLKGFQTYQANFVDSKPKEVFEEYLNGTEHPLQALGDVTEGTLSSNWGSVSSYFSDMSFGQFTPQFDIYGPVTLPDKLRTYGAGKSDDMSKFIPAACKAANEQCEDLDFAQYDADGDGYVDLVYVIYAGYSASYSQNDPVCIWPKSGSISNSTKYDGKMIFRYGVNSELNAYPGASSRHEYNMNGIGLFCHEFSHTMGLPDFYPAHNTDARVNNQALEDWSLMDGGEYVNNGYDPTAYTAWEREAFGWMEIETLTESTQNIEMATIDEGGKAYRIKNDADATGNEYYLLQNIQLPREGKGWNRKMYGHGLLVFHVYYNPNSFSLYYNTVNDTKESPRMTIVPADGVLFTSYNIDYKTVFTADYRRQLAGDPFPGTSSVTMLNDESGLINFSPYISEKTNESGVKLLNKALTNIREADNIITFDFIANYEEYVTGVKEIMNVSGSTDSRIYTLDGVLMGTKKDELSKGIYIIGKKKVVVK
ncbi:MAG: M6 family metalloprotease domain-containing protein [Prevotella sp.]|nr:M6 family metalloprotease domain-containing protein [Prevotella sp.]